MPGEKYTGERRMKLGAGKGADFATQSAKSNKDLEPNKRNAGNDILEAAGVTGLGKEVRSSSLSGNNEQEVGKNDELRRGGNRDSIRNRNSEQEAAPSSRGSTRRPTRPGRRSRSRDSQPGNKSATEPINSIGSAYKKDPQAMRVAITGDSIGAIPGFFLINWLFWIWTYFHFKKFEINIFKVMKSKPSFIINALGETIGEMFLVYPGLTIVTIQAINAVNEKENGA